VIPIKVNTVALRQSLRTLSAGILAIITARYFPTSQDYWIILSACLLVQVRVGDLFKYHLLSQLTAGLLAALLVFFSSFLGKNLLFISIFLGITSLSTIYVGFRWKNLFFAVYIVNLFVMIGGGMPVDLQIAAARRQCVITGMAIAMLVTFTSWPSYYKFAVKEAILNCRNVYRKMLTHIFSIYLMHDYLPHYLDYEKKLYQLSREFFYWSQTLSRLSKEKPNKKLPLKNIERIFELITALGLLRYRVKDHTTFEVIDQELKNILASLIKKLKKPNLMNNISSNIEKLEEVYQSALQVVSQEPIVFLFFIENLKALVRELDAV